MIPKYIFSYYKNRRPKLVRNFDRSWTDFKDKDASEFIIKIL